MSELAVKGCKIRITDVSITASAITIITEPSEKVLVDNKGVYKGTISVQLTNMSKGSYSLPSGVIVINGTADAVLCEGESSVQKGDKGSAVFTFKDSDNEPSIVTVEIEIYDSGQTSVISS